MPMTTTTTTTTVDADASRVPRRQASSIEIKRRRRRNLWLFTGFILVCIVAAVLFGPDLLDDLLLYLEGVDANDPNVALVFWFLIWATVTPVSTGYGFVLLGIGFVYGWWGFFLAYPASITGCWVVFGVTRAIAKHYKFSYKMFAELPIVPRRWAQYLLASEKAIEAKPYKMCTLLQLSFLPLGILNSILATTKISFRPFVLATFISRTKIINYIWVGATASDLSKVWKATPSFDTQDIVILVVSSVFSIVSGVALTIWSQRAIANELESADPVDLDEWSTSDEDEEDEQEEQLTFQE